MSNTSSMRQRLLADIDARVLLEAEIKEAEDERVMAKVAFEEAQAALATAEARLNGLHSRIAALTQSVGMLSRALSTLSTFPFELLSLIFAYANTDTAKEQKRLDTSFEPPTAPDHNRVMLPWRLASVCRHWRAAVLGTGEAWSYLGIAVYSRSFTRAARAKYKWRVAQLLKRSGSALLDVVLTNAGLPFEVRPGNEGEARDIVAEEDNFFETMTHLLSMHMGRMRSLHVRYHPPTPHSAFSTNIARDKVAEVLRAPSPALLDVRIHLMPYPTDSLHTEAGYWHNFPDEPFPLFFPDAPKLRTLVLAYIPVACRRPHRGLPSLERLAIFQDRMCPVHVADMLGLAPNLQKLMLLVGSVLHFPTVIPAFEPSLNVSSLTLAGPRRDQTFGLLENGARLLPALSHLDISTLDFLDVTESLAQRLTTLCISVVWNLQDHLVPLRQLRCIQHAEFSDVSIQDDVFFGPFCEADDPMWPKLRKLKLEDVTFLTVEQDGILRLVRARNAKNDSNDPQAAPKCPALPLEDLEFDVESVPTWIAVQIRAILPGKHDDGVFDADGCPDWSPL